MAKREKPDFEGFAKAVMASWPEVGIDAFELQLLAERFGMIVEIPGGFDPDIHVDMYGCAERGDAWFERVY